MRPLDARFVVEEVLSTGTDGVRLTEAGRRLLERRLSALSGGDLAEALLAVAAVAAELRHTEACDGLLTLVARQRSRVLGGAKVASADAAGNWRAFSQSPPQKVGATRRGTSLLALRTQKPNAKIGHVVFPGRYM